MCLHICPRPCHEHHACNVAQCELAFRSDFEDHLISERRVKQYPVGQSPYSHVILGMLPIDPSHVDLKLRSVTMSGRRFATLNGNTYDSSNYRCSSSTHLAIPDGWELAPYDDDTVAALRKGIWGTECLVLADGSAWRTTQQGLCNQVYTNLEFNDNIYFPKYRTSTSCYHEIFLRSSTIVPVPDYIDDSDYGFSMAGVGR